MGKWQLSPRTDFTPNQRKHIIITQPKQNQKLEPDSNASPAVVSGEDFQMAELDLQTGCAAHSTTSFPDMTCPRTRAESSYKIHTSSNCWKVHLDHPFFINLPALLKYVREPELGFVKSLDKQTCCPFVRPSLSKTSSSWKRPHCRGWWTTIVSTELTLSELV